MVSDHTAANDRLKSLTETSKIPVPRGFDDKHKAMRAMFESWAEPSWTLPISMNITDHQTAQLLEWEIGSGEDAKVQRFASETLPTLLRHLRIAREIKARLASRLAPDGIAAPDRR